MMEPGGLDRRRFVTRGAAVAGAAWTAPVLRTIRLGQAEGSPPPTTTTPLQTAVPTSTTTTTTTALPDGFVTGGGFVADHRRFGFNARNGTDGPSGEVTFLFGAGPPTMVKSVELTGVTVDGDRATITGTAKVDGTVGYSFRVDVVDGDPDRFAILVHDADGTVYHQSGAPEAPLEVQGSIQIH